MKSKFSSLVDHLNAALFVFIENEFEYRDKPEEILAFILAMPAADRELLYAVLEELNESELVKVIKKIQVEFEEFHPEESHYNLLNSGDLTLALEMLENAEHFLMKNVKEVCLFLEERLSQETRSLNEVFLRFGIAYYPEYCWQILNDIKSMVPTKSIRVFKTVPDIDEFLGYVDNRLQLDEFCVCIVDKFIGGDPRAGISFVKELLKRKESREEASPNIASVIFTSHDEQEELKNREDYFIIQANKTDLDGMVKGLAYCAYAELFGNLKNIHLQSVESATQLAWSRKGNVSYLAAMAQIEGITPFEAIQNWFHLLVQSGTIKRLLQTGDQTRQQYQFMLGLTHFLNDEVLFSEGESGYKLGEEYQDLDTFEIFDYTVNQQHMPPAPGDVFFIDGQYRILVGQDCDTIVRKKNEVVTRNLKHADLLKADFDQRGIDRKVITIADGVNFNYFKDARQLVGALKIVFRAQETSDFQILDTCTFNEDGTCQIPLSEPLLDNVRRLLPKFWHSHYDTIQKTLQKINEVREKIVDVELLKINRYSLFDNVIVQGRATFPIRRICRIKKDFLDVLLTNYWNYRGRIGVNTISNSIEEELSIPEFMIGRHGGHQKVSNASGYTKATLIKSASSDSDIHYIPLILDLEFLKKCKPFLREISQSSIRINGKSEIHAKTGILFEKIKNEDNRLDCVRITQPLHVDATGVKFTDEVFDVRHLLNEDQLSQVEANSEIAFFLDHEGNRRPLFDQEKEPILYSIELLRNGIKFEGLEVGFKTERARVTSVPYVRETSEV